MSLDVLVQLSLHSASGLILMRRIRVAEGEAVSVVSWHPGPADTEMAPPESGEQTWLTWFGFLTSSIVIVMMADLRHLIRAARKDQNRRRWGEYYKNYLRDFSTIKCLSAWPSAAWIFGFEFSDSSDSSLLLSNDRPPGPENRNCCLAWLVWKYYDLKNSRSSSITTFFILLFLASRADDIESLDKSTLAGLTGVLLLKSRWFVISWSYINKIQHYLQFLQINSTAGSMGGSGESFLGGASFGMLVNPGDEADGCSEKGVDLLESSLGGSLWHAVLRVSGTDILLFSCELDTFDFDCSELRDLVSCSLFSESSVLLLTSWRGLSHNSFSLHKSGCIGGSSP